METKANTETTKPLSLAALMHEWFVEYNPIYLFSAALVLAGLTLVSRDLAASHVLEGFGVAAIAELYAFALIGGAAFLHRLGARRVAVMVGLLAALYQCDLTMHVETCAFLGGVGKLAAIAWVALFALKLRLLAAALSLRPSFSALAVPILGAAAIAYLPQAIRGLAPDARASLVGLVVFAVAALALWTPRTIESAFGFDYRGRRAIRGVWLMWAGGALLHVGYWALQLGVPISGLLPAFALLLVRFTSRERSVWNLVGATLLAVAVFEPAALWRAALMATVVLALRALRSPVHVDAPLETSVAPPYRGVDVEHPTTEPETVLAFTFADAAAMQRLLLGAATSLHLAVWTASTPATFWLAHLPLLDLALVVACANALWARRSWTPFAPVLAIGTHLAMQREWLTAPDDAAELGIWSITLGFVALGLALFVSWRAQRAAIDAPSEDAPSPFR
jgi:hypothetical protein